MRSRSELLRYAAAAAPDAADTGGAWVSWPSWWGTCRWRWPRPPPMSSRPGSGWPTTWSCCAAGRGSCSGWTGLDPAGQGSGPEADRRRVATVWSVSLDQVRPGHPAAEALMSCARSSARTSPAPLPDRAPRGAARAAGRGGGRSAGLQPARCGCWASSRWSSLDPATISVHRLVQAVVRARLDPAEERAWAERAVALLRAAFPERQRGGQRPGRSVSGCCPSCWPSCEHAERLRWPESRPAGCSTGRRPTCGSAASTARRCPLAERALAVTAAALGPDHVDVAGGTTSWAACCRIWGT